MEEPAQYFLFHGVIILFLVLLAGIPYGKAILKKKRTVSIALELKSSIHTVYLFQVIHFHLLYI